MELPLNKITCYFCNKQFEENRRTGLACGACWFDLMWERRLVRYAAEEQRIRERREMVGDRITR